MTFVVVGAGPTGVEMAGAIGELARSILAREFRRISAASPRILLLEGGNGILPSFAAELSGAAMGSLARLGVMVRTDCVVTEVRPARSHSGAARRSRRSPPARWSGPRA